MITAGVAAASSGTTPRPWSLWACAAAFCAGGLVPPLCVFGPILGVAGLRETRRRGYRGRRLAWAAIIVGTVLTAAWGTLVAYATVAVRGPIITGPRAALDRGLAGDVAGFRDAFVPTALPEADAEAEAVAFLAALESRYGSFVSIALDPQRPLSMTAGELMNIRIPKVVPYRITFAEGACDADAEFRVGSPDGLPMILRWGWIRVRDADRGDLSYPDGATEQESGDVKADP